jgi:hypothetical protein
MTKKITHIDVEVRPSIGFQTVGYTARVQFDEPLDAVEALANVADVRELLTEQAHADIDQLVAKRQSSDVEQRAQAPSAPSFTAPSADGWAIANKPAGKGTFRYLTTSVVSSDDFRAAVVAQLPSLGIDPEDVDVYDDRVGNYGLEKGNDSYTAGKIKVKTGTKLEAALNGKNIVGGADFAPDGSVKVSLSKDGKAAIQALQIAENLKASAI